MKLYNTLSRSLTDIHPLKAPVVTIYTCGPTVYDYPHIGNWFTFVRYDLLNRTLTASGLTPLWVMNITDVGHLVGDADEGEDKLQKGARREGKSAWDVAAFYTQNFVDGLAKLNIRTPDKLPKATDHIKEQIALVEALEAKGFTYKISDGIYYDTAKFPRYAEFARLDIDEQQAGARVEYNTEKRNVSDFALWKFSPKGEKRDMEWESPWGIGFPGWHVECSAMSMKYLGETMDIHAGGIDHIPVHHTNEIAQSEAVTDKPFATVWMHANHISINGDKISKSLNNGITLEDIVANGHSLDAVRLHMLESHYRSQSKFSWDNLMAATNRLRDFQALADLRFQLSDTPAGEVNHAYDHYKQAILAAMQDDLNTPEALRIISELANEQQSPVPAAAKESFVNLLSFIDDILGLRLTVSEDITNGQKERIAARQTARLAKDWATSDRIRDELIAQGIGLRDTEAGAVWFRV